MANRAQSVAERVQARLIELGVSSRKASLDATGKPDLIRDLERGRMPSADRLSALAAVLKMGVAELIGEAGGSDTAPLPLREPRQSYRALNDLPLDVPVLGSALGANLRLEQGTRRATEVERTEIDTSYNYGFVRRFPALADRRDTYALYIAGSSMEPRYSSGDLVYVDPKRPPAIGDDVVVQLAGDRENETGDTENEVVSALVKRLVRRTAAFVELEQFEPRLTLKLDVTRITAIHRIIPLNELAGS